MAQNNICNMLFKLPGLRLGANLGSFAFFYFLITLPLSDRKLCVFLLLRSQETFHILLCQKKEPFNTTSIHTYIHTSNVSEWLCK
jgi:hypothetical protein